MPGPAAWRRRGWLALIGGVHLLAFLGWQTPERPLGASVSKRAAITYILAPVPVVGTERPHPAVQPAIKLAREARRPVAPAATAPAITAPLPEREEAIGAAQSRLAAPEAATSPSAPPHAITQSLPDPDPFAQPATKPADDLLQRSLKSAATIDKQMRKEAWNPSDKKIANDTTMLAAKLAGAYTGNNGVMSMEQITMPDGRLMTKVRTRGGSFCAYMESNALTGGRDPFRDGVRTKVGNCPQ